MISLTLWICLQTFALPDSVIPLRYQALWGIVHAAQRTALEVAANGTITSAVDKAARKIIKEAGYGEFFTHRLGHGEPQPLVAGTQCLIQRYPRHWSRGSRVTVLGRWVRRRHSNGTHLLGRARNLHRGQGEYLCCLWRTSFTDLVRQVGVRLEDCFYIDEDGVAQYLTAGVGAPATSPWTP